MKSLMQKITEVMDEMVSSKKDDEEAKKAKKKMVDTPSPWSKATDLDAKMSRQMKDAGL